MDDRESAYRLIRTMCSPSLNAILTVKAEFIAVELDDPLKLLEVIKSVVTSRCDGNQEFERSQALRDWYTLTMSAGADIVPYGRRAVKLFDRLAATGVPDAQIPNAVQQATKLIEASSYGRRVYLKKYTPRYTFWKPWKNPFTMVRQKLSKLGMHTIDPLICQSISHLLCSCRESKSIHYRPIIRTQHICTAR